ncbi:MAG: phosphoribosylformylglycinamidine synthase I [Elusimicrobia bacterium RIFOXYB2_FULL_49_7]|nr:MAG: phosphoribosylformylglycinamidine synthase I [Elusimicrobia bacterium RIFOXYB2_FULL_49_7]
MKFGIITFPGSNGDHDCYHMVRHVLGAEASYLWHQDRDLQDSDAVILPGGFSYGDYLRCGAIARFSPIMEEVSRFSKNGGPVIGVGNGFQVLTEAGLLPGALLRNRSLKFICKDVYLKVERSDTLFTNRVPTKVIKIPIAHNEGNYFADDELLERIEGEGRVVFRYSALDGRVVEEVNPNGSRNNIAGILSFNGRTLGMMPHPERCSERILSNSDGLALFQSMMENVCGS